MVEDVVAFHTNLDVAGSIAAEREVLGEDHVGVVAAGAVIRIAVNVAEPAERLHVELAGCAYSPVEPAAVTIGKAGARILTRQRSKLFRNIRAGIEAQ